MEKIMLLVIFLSLIGCVKNKQSESTNSIDITNKNTNDITNNEISNNEESLPITLDDKEREDLSDDAAKYLIGKTDASISDFDIELQEEIITFLGSEFKYQDLFYDELDKLDINIIVDLLNRGNIPFDGYLYPTVSLYRKIIDEPQVIPDVEKKLEMIWEDGLSIAAEMGLSGEKVSNCFDNIMKMGIEAKESNNLVLYYDAKRYLTYFRFGFYIFSGDFYVLSVLNVNLFKSSYLEDESFWRYGLWTLYDNDTGTPAVLDKDTFKIVLKKDKPIKIYNGHGYSEKLYQANARIKSLIGYTKADKEVIIELDDEKGWQEISLPDEITDSSITFTINEIYLGVILKCCVWKKSNR